MGNRRVLPTQHAARGGKPCTAKRAPEALQGLEWVVQGWTDVRAARSAPRTTLRARSVPQGPSLSWDPWKCRLWANMARIDLIFLKVSQNRRVSPKYPEKACHSPYLQNGLGKSALGKPRFPFSSAFSHKELLGHNRPYVDFIVKMTKCRVDVHVREGVGVRCRGLRCA